MDTSTPIEDSFLETLDASSSSASSIHMEWNINSGNMPFVEGYRVHYQKVASTYIHYGPKLDPSNNAYEIENLVADTYYKVCLVVYRNDSIPFRECIDASTTNWQLPVSVGSSIGAILALSMIVLIVLLSRCNIPLQYRSKKAKRSQKYDTISSNYHDDQYDFSETATHGQDDDYTSEYDHDEEAYYEMHVPEARRVKTPYLPERPSLPNGLSRTHVHPHSHVQHHSQHRNSLGRIQFNQSHHHPRQMRAYSMQAAGNMSFLNHPCSPLAKEPRKYSLERGDSQHSADAFQEQSNQFTNSPHNTAREIISPTKGSLPNAHKTCSPSLHAFSFIDEIPESSAKSSTSKSKSNDSVKNGTKSTMPSDNLLITDIDFEDMSQYGASGGTSTIPSNKTIEMSSTNRMLALPESISFEEHSV